MLPCLLVGITGHRRCWHHRCSVGGAGIWDDRHTVDGQIISPVDMVDVPLFTGFHTCQLVVWDL